jgi:hypothetical protein
VLDERVAHGLVDNATFVVGRRRNRAALPRLVSIEIIVRDPRVALRGISDRDDPVLLDY